MPQVAGCWLIRRLEVADLGAYKRLRDRSLQDHPDAFSSDAADEASRDAASYLGRFGLDRPSGGQFTLGAYRDAHAEELAGAVSCEREARRKVEHIGHLTAMMVRRDCSGQGLGRSLLEAAIGQARRTAGLEMLTLSVTASNRVAVHLYERAGFTRYASLPNALKVGGRYLTKDGMVLQL